MGVYHLYFDVLDLSLKVGSKAEYTEGGWNVLTHWEPEVLRRLDEGDADASHLDAALRILSVDNKDVYIVGCVREMIFRHAVSERSEP